MFRSVSRAPILRNTECDFMTYWQNPECASKSAPYDSLRISNTVYSSHILTLSINLMLNFGFEVNCCLNHLQTDCTDTFRMVLLENVLRSMTTLAHLFLIKTSAFCRESDSTVSEKVSVFFIVVCERKRYCIDV
jgi:hypothetical protein